MEGFDCSTAEKSELQKKNKTKQRETHINVFVVSEGGKDVFLFHHDSAK